MHVALDSKLTFSVLWYMSLEGILDPIPYFGTMTLMNIFLFVLILFDVCSLKLTVTGCQRRCEQRRGSIAETGMKHRAIQGHSFKNYTLSKVYDCHVKCFEEKCKRQAYQIGKHQCELLDVDRFSAPEDFVEADGYVYFDRSREYVNQVTNKS